MNFCFKDEEEAFFAYLLASLGPLQDGSSLLAQSTRRRSHERLDEENLIKSLRFGVHIACFSHTLFSMPREIRKRGKKHKKAQNQTPPEGQTQEQEEHNPDDSCDPSWIVSAPEAEGVHPEAPFGYVDPDVKAYFRTVDEQIQSWQEDRIQPVDEDGDLDPNEGAC